MPEKNSKQLDQRRDDGVELETQFILRMPEEPSRILKEAIETGANNLKDRFSIKLDNELRYGEVRLDHHLLHTKVYDLPTVIEALKTIDNKSFYKTADICQLMICRTEPEQEEEESPNKNKKKDPNKVDKKFLFPHGITPPCKNVRKRRFRKTLKKKYVEMPEIEKELKRLLRLDNEAINVKWDLINEEDEIKPISKKEAKKQEKANAAKQSKPSTSSAFNAPSSSGMSLSQGTSRDVGEHDIFGGEVSSSDEEENNVNVLDLDDNSRLSADLSDSNSLQGQSQGDKIFTEFNKNMFNSPRSKKSGGAMNDMNIHGVGQPFGNESDEFEQPVPKEIIQSRIEQLNRQLNDLKAKSVSQSQEVNSMQNQTLRQRLQYNLDTLLGQILDKEMELQDLLQNL